MKNIFKKTVAFVLAAFIAFGANAFVGYADNAGGECGENLLWSFDSASGELTVTGDGPMDDFLASQSPWYSLRGEIKSVTVSDGAEDIGNNAFYNCAALESVQISGTVTDIGKNAFRDCGSLEEIVLPENLQVIGDAAFYASALKSVEIPACVTAVGANAFGWCASLENITVSADNGYYSDDSGVLFSKDKSELIKFPDNSKKTGYVIPASAVKVADYAFENSVNLRTVSVPSGVTEIGEGAFFNSSLESILVDSANASYSCDANGVLFNKAKTVLIHYPSCGSVSEYQVPETVEIIEDGAFHNVGKLKGIILSDGISEIGDYAFLFCENLEYIHIPAGVTVIGEEIADYTSAYICSDAENAYAKEYAEANGYEFRACGVHESGREIIAYGVCGETAKWVLYADGELVISGEGATDDFEQNKAPWADYSEEITAVSVENGITYISENAFYNCENIATVTVPESVTGIGASAFEGCSALEKAVFTGDISDWCAIDFANEYSNPGYCAPELYFSGKLVEDIVIPDDVDAIGNYAFAGFDGADTISFGGTKKIGNGAFFGCTGLKNIAIPESVNEIGAEAFAGCTSLEFIHVPDTVTEIGEAVAEKSAYICSDSENAYAKEYAEANGYEFVLCQNHKTLGVSLSETEIEITKGSTYKLEAVISPETPFNAGVKWSTDNPSVAFVDENGTVSAVSVGEAVITVTTDEGGYTATCKVTVISRSFTVFWVSDGVEIFSDTVEENGVIPMHDEPEKAGHSFTGWTPAIPDKMPARDLVFVAGWQVNSYTAVFDANGGSWQDGSTEKEFLVEYGRRINAPENPEKEGYFFLKWSPEVTVMDSESGKRFTAVWAADSDTEYRVRTHVMQLDGKYESTTDKFAAETDSTVYAEYAVDDGFVLNTEKSVLSGAVAADGSLVLEVYLDRIRYTVTLNGKKNEYLYGETVQAPEIPEAPEGHCFSGWADENGNEIKFPLTVNEDIPEKTVPVFSKLSYTVTWVVDGSSTVETYEYQQQITVPADPEKYGYEFKGWSPEIPDNMPAENLTFTAAFDKIYYTCTDCGEVFGDETEFNEHVAYENAKKAMRVSIVNNPSTAKIKYGETLKLTAKVTGEAEGVEIRWYVDGAEKGKGETFSISFESGTKTVEVKLVDAQGNCIKDEAGNEISDSQKVTVNASFWQKIVSFFKNLFRLNRTVIQNIYHSI